MPYLLYKPFHQSNPFHMFLLISILLLLYCNGYILELQVKFEISTSIHIISITIVKNKAAFEIPFPNTTLLLLTNNLPVLLRHPILHPPSKINLPPAFVSYP